MRHVLQISLLTSLLIVLSADLGMPSLLANLSTSIYVSISTSMFVKQKLGRTLVYRVLDLACGFDVWVFGRSSLCGVCIGGVLGGEGTVGGLGRLLVSITSDD